VSGALQLIEAGLGQLRRFVRVHVGLRRKNDESFMHGL
jgi:hypothetical protein